jgi:hypothetical protein
MTRKAYCTRWCDPSALASLAAPLLAAQPFPSYERPNVVRGTAYFTDSCFPYRQPCLTFFLAIARDEEDPLAALPTLFTCTVISQCARQVESQPPQQQLQAGPSFVAVIPRLLAHGDCPKRSFGEGNMAEVTSSVRLLLIRS